MKTSPQHHEDRVHTVRSFREGDAEALTSLFNRYYQSYAGFSERTVEHWKWCCLGQPDIGVEGLLIATEDDDIVGYAAVGRPKTVGGGFHIHELCYDAERNGREIVSKLLEDVLRHAQQNGGTGISLEAPSDDSILREVCLQLGLSKRWGRRPAYAVVAIDMPGLLTKIMMSRVKNLAAGRLGFAINLVDLSPPNYVVVRNDGDRISVSTEASAKPRLTIETDYATMTRLIFGSDSALSAVLGGRVRIRPLWASLRGIKILSKLRLETPWFIPRTDQI
ncbi:MAG: GNAT family N-acetyltransferase [Candidatus Bathyarchaeia archaeon]